MALERLLVERVDALLDALPSGSVPSGSVPTGAWTAISDAELMTVLERIGAVRRVVDSLGMLAAGEVDRRGDVSPLHVRMADKSPGDLVARCAQIEPTEARAWCTAGAAVVDRVSPLAESLAPRREQLAGSVQRAEVSAGVAAQVAVALDDFEAVADREFSVVDAELFLLQHAGRLTARDTVRLGRALIERFDPDGAEPREDRLRAQAGLAISRSHDGLTRWVLTMDPEAAGFLTAALDARTAPRREPSFAVVDDARDRDALDRVALGETRSLSRRRLDAMVSIARESLELDPGEVGGTAVTMVVTVPLQTLLDGVGSATIEGVDAPIGASTARRLAASADIIPLVLGAESETLDLGHSRRLFSPAQRRVLAQRDGGCLWPSCPAPPGWCEVAHVTAWSLGGVTDLRNAALFCPFHHRRFDTDGWSLQWRGRDPFLVPPSHVDARRAPRRAGRARLPRSEAGMNTTAEQRTAGVVG